MELLIIPLACGAIGYFTNWLAIKMLFRPFKEKKILGIKLPFTPGVLPRRKPALAKQIGESVSKHLLTEDMIRTAILNDKVDKKINDILDDLYKKLCEDDKSLEVYLNEILGDRSNVIVDDVVRHVKVLTYKYLNEESFKRRISLALKDKIMETLESDEIKAYVASNKDVFKEKLGEIINVHVGKLEDGKPLKELIPEEYVTDIKKAIFDNAPYLIEFIKKELESNEVLDSKIKELIKKILDDKLGRLVGGLFHNKVRENMKESIIEYLDDEDTRVEVVEKIWSLIDVGLSKDMSFIIEKTRGLEYKKIGLEYITSKIDGNKDVLFSEIYTSIKSSLEEEIFKSVYISIDRFGNEELGIIMDKYENKIKSHILNINISNMFISVGKDKFKIIKDYIILKSKSALSVCADHVVKELNVKELVEEKLNNFEDEEFEGMILAVAKKELKYITLMGGVLGFVLGFLLEFLRLMM